MKTLWTLLAFLLFAPCAWAANCTITGTVFNPDGTPLKSGQVQFNSVVQQTLQGGAVIPPTFISANTDANGNISAMSIVQGLQGQFTFCSPSAGGCGNPTPVLIPVAPTADISAILIGIQLSSGGQVVASSLNVTGNTTMGGTLEVTGATTLGVLTAGSTTVSTLNVTGTTTFGAQVVVNAASGICFPDQGCWNNTGIVTLTHLGVGGYPALNPLIAQLGETAVASYVGTADALGTNINMDYFSGAHMNASAQWVADVTYPILFSQVSSAGNGAETGWSSYGPQTVGQPVSFSNRVQYMALRTNTPGAQAGLFIESGGIDIINGGFTANGGSLGTGITMSHYQNAATEIQSYNWDGNDPNSGAVVRANNGAYVTDVGIVGPNANFGGFFIGNRSYIAGNGGQGFLVEATGAGAGGHLYLSAPNANIVDVIGNQHFGVQNSNVSVPHVTGTCGGGGQVNPPSTDTAGAVNVGPSADTSCVVQIAASWNTANCVCSTRTNTWCSINPSSSGFTLQFGAAITGWVTWICITND